MKKVYYLNYFDVPQNKDQNRNCALSAVTKSSYVTGALVKAGYEVEIVSMSYTQNNKFCNGSVTVLPNGASLRLFDSLPYGNIIKRVISRNVIKKKAQKYILDNITSDDVLVVYHSLAYTKNVQKIVRKKNPKLVIEATEIYSDVYGKQESRQKEIDYLRSADSYIMSTELLNNEINIEQKPYSINYGTYDIPKDFSNNKLFNDGKIHIVYAGILDSRKGAPLVVESAKYLPDNYCIHILGFGKEDEVNQIKKQIESVSLSCKCQIEYNGKLSGDEYLKFIQSCDIGVVPQSSNAEFSDTSFPSKVLSYLSNGLRVVSVRIKSLEISKIADYISFYNEDTPRALADRIISINSYSDYNGREILKQLDQKFVSELKTIIKG